MGKREEGVLKVGAGVSIDFFESWCNNLAYKK